VCAERERERERRRKRGEREEREERERERERERPCWKEESGRLFFVNVPRDHENSK